MANVTLLAPFDPISSSNPSYATQPPLRLAYLSALTKALGHATTVIDGVGIGYGQVWKFNGVFELHGLTIDQIIERIPQNTDVLGCSLTYTQTYPAVRELLRRIRGKLPNTPLVIGGEGVSGIADFAVGDTEADAAVIGPGEAPWDKILDNFSAGRSLDGIGRVVTRNCLYDNARRIQDQGSYTDVNAIPFPCWDDIPLETYWQPFAGAGVSSFERYLPIVASRGCPFKCFFCTAATTWGGQHYRSQSNVIDEIRHLVDKYDIPFFSFNDLSLTTNLKWFDKFLDALSDSGIQIQWNVPTGIRVSLNRGLLEKAKKVGLNYVQIAPETGSQKVLDWLNKRFSIEATLKTVKIAKDLDLPVSAYMIVGTPVETIGDFILSLKFLYKLARMGVDEISISQLVALPGSPFFWELLREGRLKLDDDYFLSLCQADFKKQDSYSPFFSGKEVVSLRLIALLWFFSLTLVFFPRKYFKLLFQPGRGGRNVKIARVLRYRKWALATGFLPVFSITTIKIVFRIIKRLAFGVKKNKRERRNQRQPKA